MLKNSLNFRFMALIAAVLAVTMAGVVFVADTQLKEILDRSHSELYGEKLNTIAGRIEQQRQQPLNATAKGAGRIDLKWEILSAVAGDDQLRDLKRRGITPFFVAKGRTILPPRLPEDTSLPMDEPFLAKLTEMRNGEFNCRMGGQERWAIFRFSEARQLVIGFTIPLSVKYDDAKKFRTLFILTMAVITLIVTLFLALMVTKITDPIIALTAVASKMADGSLDQPIDVKGRDELGVLARAFARMRGAIHEKITALNRMNEALEIRVEARTSHLVSALMALLKTRDHLAQTEKMAALGELIAGVTHEINTPIGIGVTEASFLDNITRRYSELYRTGKLTRADFEKYLHHAVASSSSILRSLRRAADLLNSFKQVAVDRASEEKRVFDVGRYIDEMLLSLRSRYKHSSHAITVQCREGTRIQSYPGIFSQIITQLVNNAFLHAFDDIETGKVILDVRQLPNELIVTCHDNGAGMTKETLAQVFEPFFTTRRLEGRTGMGLHIVHNLVTRKLNGRIRCRSTPGRGSVFTLLLPLEARGAGDAGMDRAEGF